MNGADPITTGTGELSPVLTCSSCGTHSESLHNDMHGWDSWGWLNDVCLCPRCLEKTLGGK